MIAVNGDEANVIYGIQYPPNETSATSSTTSSRTPDMEALSSATVHSACARSRLVNSFSLITLGIHVIFGFLE